MTKLLWLIALICLMAPIIVYADGSDPMPTCRTCCIGGQSCK